MSKSIRLHFEARDGKTPFMYVFAEPVTEEQADEIQTTGDTAQKDFARRVVGVGRDNPKVQAAWHNFQDEVDEQVDEDKNGHTASKAQEEEVKVLSEEAVNESEHPSGDEGDPEIEVSAGDTSTPESASNGPLMGWTLTVRSKVNGGYVERPEKLDERDDWKIEYHIQDIPQDTRWKLYNAVKDRRQKLIGQDEEEVDKGLKHYRDLIQRYSDRGREWRKRQDEMDEGKGPQVFKPLGPGSEATPLAEDTNGRVLPTATL